MKYFFSYIFLFFLGVQSVLAQSETFNVRIFGGFDITPPSTPVLLTVSPVAETQIDISWSSSTDNYAVTGYSVLRDGSAIATTTLLSYSDTGLVASTVYSYEVRAFDAAVNYSSTSNSLSTTTLETPVVPVEEPGISEGTVARIVIDELIVEEGVSTTSLILTTARPSRIEVRWGRSASYELGYVVSDVYSSEHAIRLTDLEPGTRYEYEIIGYTPHGFQSVIHNGSFVTNTENVITAPANVSRFQAFGVGSDVNLSWDIPAGDNISYVRLVRSHLGYPEHPQDGAVVYQGLGGVFRDEGILDQYSPVYYTVFVYDIFGNVSSGAVTVVYATPTENEESQIVTGVEGEGDGDGGVDGGEAERQGQVVFTEEATSSVSVDRVTIDMKMPELSEITIVQDQNVYTLLDTGIALDSEQVFKISLPYSSVAGNLKSIIVSFVDPTDNRQTYSFLLRINKDQTAYEAIIEPLGVVGDSQVVVEIYDYEAFVVASYKNSIIFTVIPEMRSDEVVFPDAIFNSYYLILLLLLIPLVLILLLYLFYRSRDEDKE